ncbi:hypothetical protein X281_05670, partial [Oenococcus oeni IOEB_0607]|uniref:prealbumin-like fold domain-containing protein n=1 Tax=Oenococcus oeni TaxID=1247 RepID=UPI00050E9496
DQENSVTLTKTDSSDNDIVKGAIFSIYTSDGKLVKDNLTTDANGQIEYQSQDLTSGNYYFVETNAPDGYQLSSKHYDFTITKNLQSTVKVSADDQENAVVLTKLTVTAQITARLKVLSIVSIPAMENLLKTS